MRSNVGSMNHKRYSSFDSNPQLFSHDKLNPSKLPSLRMNTSTFNKKRSKLSPLNNYMSQAHHIDSKRNVIFKQRKMLGKGIYNVEISQNDTQSMIEAIDENSPESYLIEMDNQRAEKIFKLFKYKIRNKNTLSSYCFI